MKRQIKTLALFFLLAIAAGVASPAKALDLHNCTPVNLRLKFYNEIDPVELIAKRRVNLAAGASRTGIMVPGIGTHKVKIYNQSAGGQLITSLKKVNGRLSYVLFLNPDGTLGMVTGVGCIVRPAQ